MARTDQTLTAYNQVAAKYAAQFFDELAGKPLDKILLQYFLTQNQHKGTLLDLGCGPGQTTKFLTDNGCDNILGTDLSPGMIAEAKRLNPKINFEVADMLQLRYPNDSFGSAIAFYAIVNLQYPQIALAFGEINRVLKPGGQLMFSFHAGDEHIHFDEFLEEKVEIDFYFLNVDQLSGLLKDAGFEITETIIRYPYALEHPTRRAYITAEKIQALNLNNLSEIM